MTRGEEKQRHRSYYSVQMDGGATAGFSLVTEWQRHLDNWTLARACHVASFAENLVFAVCSGNLLPKCPYFYQVTTLHKGYVFRVPRYLLSVISTLGKQDICSANKIFVKCLTNCAR